MADYQGFIVPPGGLILVGEGNEVEIPAAVIPTFTDIVLVGEGNEVEIPGLNGVYTQDTILVDYAGAGLPEAVDPPEEPDITPPVISGFDPAPGSQLQRNQSVAFDVTDDSGSFIRIFVVAFFPSLGPQEVIHDGEAFVGNYSGSSSRVPITNGFRYTVNRTGGWPAAPTFRVFPIDSSGNQI